MKQINRQAHLAPAKALFVNMFVTKTAEHEDMQYRPGCLQQMVVMCRQGMQSAKQQRRKRIGSCDRTRVTSRLHEKIEPLVPQ